MMAILFGVCILDVPNCIFTIVVIGVVETEGFAMTIFAQVLDSLLRQSFMPCFPGYMLLRLWFFFF